MWLARNDKSGLLHRLVREPDSRRDVLSAHCGGLWKEHNSVWWVDDSKRLDWDYYCSVCFLDQERR